VIKSLPKKVQEKRNNLNRTYERLFNSPDGKVVLEDLEFRFNGTTLKSHDGVIDPYRSIAAGGCREVLLYISQMRKHNVMD